MAWVRPNHGNSIQGVVSPLPCDRGYRRKPGLRTKPEPCYNGTTTVTREAACSYYDRGCGKKRGKIRLTESMTDGALNGSEMHPRIRFFFFFFFYGSGVYAEVMPPRFRDPTHFFVVHVVTLYHRRENGFSRSFHTIIPALPARAFDVSVGPAKELRMSQDDHNETTAGCYRRMASMRLSHRPLAFPLLPPQCQGYPGSKA